MSGILGRSDYLDSLSDSLMYDSKKQRGNEVGFPGVQSIVSKGPLFISREVKIEKKTTVIFINCKFEGNEFHF